jgi:tetratricopeptide (TPR) repeat protein
MRNIKVLKKILQTIDICAIGLTLMALVFFCVFQIKPSLIDDLDKHLLNQYRSFYEKKYFTAQKALDKNIDAGLNRFLALEKEFESVHKGDRLAVMRQVVFTKLSNIYLNKKDYDSALHWIEQWIAFDERDFNAKLKKVELLILSPGRYREGIDYLYELHERYPDVKAIKRQWNLWSHG